MTHAQLRSEVPRAPGLEPIVHTCPGELALKNTLVDVTENPPHDLAVFHCPDCNSLIVHDTTAKLITNDYPVPFHNPGAPN